MKYTKQNRENIRSLVHQKAGISALSHQTQCRISFRRTVLAAAMILCTAMLAAFAVPLFTPLDGDELTLRASYQGNGIVSVFVENKSHKELTFDQQVKLISWNTKEEIPQKNGKVILENATIPAGSSGTLTVDLKDVYDVQALETTIPGRPAESYYYLLLTNRDFLFGHDWMCSFHFTVDTPEDQKLSADSLGASQTLETVEESLRFYFERAYHDVIPAFNQANFDYQQKLQELLMRTEGSLVRPVDPWITVARPQGQHFSDAGANYHSLDGYNRMVGSVFSGEYSDYSLQIMTTIPQSVNDSDGGRALPLIYLFVYEKCELEVEKPYAFLSGRIIPFTEMERYKVYEDERYVLYDTTDLFYTDLDSYIDYFLSTSDALYCDEEIRADIRDMYAYYHNEEILRSLIVNRQDEAEARAYQP